MEAEYWARWINGYAYVLNQETANDVKYILMRMPEASSVSPVEGLGWMTNLDLSKGIMNILERDYSGESERQGGRNRFPDYTSLLDKGQVSGEAVKKSFKVVM